jgi:RNA polymerase sigma-70 factor (ECF subfamily)
VDEREIRVCVERACSGDTAAFGELFRCFEDDVARLCRRLLGSKEAAGDASSEAFLRARRSLDQYQGAQPFRPWLLAIAAHHCVDLIRRRSRESKLFEPEEAGAAIAAPATSPLEGLLRAEEGHRLRAAIRELPDRYRVPVVLRYYADLDYGSIAETLAVSRGQVATLLFRARKRLREGLVARGGVQ